MQMDVWKKNVGGNVPPSVKRIPTRSFEANSNRFCRRWPPPMGRKIKTEGYTLPRSSMLAKQTFHQFVELGMSLSSSLSLSVFRSKAKRWPKLVSLCTRMYTEVTKHYRFLEATCYYSNNRGKWQGGLREQLLPIMNEQADRETRSIKTHVFMSAGRWEKMKRGNRWSAIGVKWAAPRREWNGKNDGGETLFIRG